DPSGEPAAYVTWDAIPDRSTVRAGNGPEWPSDSRFRRRRFGGRLFTNPPTPTESWSLIAGLPWPGWTRRNRGAGSTSPRCAVQALGARRRARVLNESEKSDWCRVLSQERHRHNAGPLRAVGAFWERREPPSGPPKPAPLSGGGLEFA